MAEADLQKFWEEYDEKSDLLSQSLDKLVARAEARSKKAEGLTGEFTEQAAMKLMESAMEALATEYVSHLEAFKLANDSMETLHHLEESEVLWRQNAKVVVKFDPNGEESAFIGQMRSLALSLFLEKLEDVSERTSHDASTENIACCLGLMAVVDHVWKEQGRPLNDPERQQLRAIAKSFR